MLRFVISFIEVFWVIWVRLFMGWFFASYLLVCFGVQLLCLRLCGDDCINCGVCFGLFVCFGCLLLLCFA